MIIAKLLGGWGRTTSDRAIPVKRRGVSTTNKVVTSDTAMKLGPWFAAHRIKRDQFAKTSLGVFERSPDGGRKAAKKHPLYRLLRVKPNRWQNAFTFKSLIFSEVFWGGNAYCFIGRTGKVVDELIPLPASQIQPYSKASGEIVYVYTLHSGEKEYLREKDVLHWVENTRDGLVGDGIVPYAANSITIATGKDEIEANLIENSGVPEGVISVPGSPPQAELDRLKKRIREEFDGPQNKGKTMFLTNGAAYDRIALTPQEWGGDIDSLAEITSASQFTGVPAIMLGDNSKATFNNMTETKEWFLEYGMDPHFVSFEMLGNTKLLTEEEQDEYFLEFDRSEFAKMDPEKTSIWLGNARNSGWMSGNECRSKFNLSPLPPDIGDVYWRPENMAPADAPYVKAQMVQNGPQNDPKQAENKPKESKKVDKKQKTSAQDASVSIISSFLRQSFSRAGQKAKNDYQRLAKKHSGDDLAAAIRSQLLDQVEIYRSELLPSVLNLARGMGEIPTGLEAQLKAKTIEYVDNFISNALRSFEERGTIDIDLMDTQALTLQILEIVEGYYDQEI